MSAVLEKPHAWTTDAVRGDLSWIQPLSEEEVAGFDAAVRHAQALGKSLLAMTPEDFPLTPAAAGALARALRSTQTGWGFCLVRGFPVTRWTEDEARLAYWGMGLHMGVARTQNAASDIMSDVRDAGGSYRTKNGRGYNTNAGLDFHVDFCDVVGLLCRRTAKSGGTSLITSSLAVLDEIERRRPDLAPVLREPFYYSLQGANAPGEPAYYCCPLAGELNGLRSFRTNRKNIIAAQRDFPEVPRLSPQQTELLDLLDELLPDPRFCYSMQLDPGDMQLLNNYVVVHSRTPFEDFEEPDRKRHLIRLWMTLPGAQTLPPDWADAFRDVRGGAVRGGNRGQHITPEFLAYEQRQAEAHGMHNVFKT
jgi:hypothetical protein